MPDIAVTCGSRACLLPVLPFRRPGALAHAGSLSTSYSHSLSLLLLSLPGLNYAIFRTFSGPVPSGLARGVCDPARVPCGMAPGVGDPARVPSGMTRAVAIARDRGARTRGSVRIGAQLGCEASSVRIRAPCVRSRPSSVRVGARRLRSRPSSVRIDRQHVRSGPRAEDRRDAGHPPGRVVGAACDFPEGFPADGAL
jgi:hypothetical protein